MVDILEHGAIAFVYRPRVQTDVTRGIDDVQAFYVVLADDGHVARRLRVGRKRLPDGQRRERFWAYVDRIGDRPADLVEDLAATEYWTKTRGLRHQPGPRLAGIGAYEVARHGTHVHLAYKLEGGQATKVREELRIAREATYLVAVFARSVDRALSGADADRRFIPLEPQHLDVPGTEMVLIAARDTLITGGVRIDPAADARDALCELVTGASGKPPSAPLLEGIRH